MIATDGKETERLYFKAIKDKNSEVIIKILKGQVGKNAPKVVYGRAKKYAKKNRIRKSDEVWLIIDKNSLSDAQLNQLSSICCESDYFLAVSNPCFELWLVLHFEKPKSERVDNATKCRHRLKKYLPNYTKNHVETEKLLPHTPKAINNAKQYANENETWPTNTGTHIYKLVEKLI